MLIRAGSNGARDLVAFHVSACSHCEKAMHASSVYDEFIVMSVVHALECNTECNTESSLTLG